MNEEEKIKDLKAAYSGAVQAGETGIANIIKGGIDLIDELQKENKELEEINNELEAEKNETIRRYNFEAIPTQKVKEKIEKLNDESHAEELEDIMIGRNYTITELVQCVLRELIEGSEEK